MSDWQGRILSLLIERYERSALYKQGEGKRRIMISVSKDLAPRMDRLDEKAAFIEALETLQRKGLITIDWEPMNEGNLAKRIILTSSPESLKTAYALIGKSFTRSVADSCEAEICTLCRSLPECPLRTFLLQEGAMLAESHHLPRFFTDNEKTNTDILKSLAFASQNDEEILERVVSTRLFGDSKYFERELKGKCISIIKAAYKKEFADIDDEDIDYLALFSIVRYSEEFAFSGNLSAQMKSGTVINFGAFPHGSVLLSSALGDIDSISIAAKKVLFIENKANYVHYITHEKGNDELVVYHGGCYSPAKKRFFALIAKALDKECHIQHWSDIDLGGFRIFMRLKTELFQNLEPFRMDEETLATHRKDAIPITDRTYLAHMKAMAEDPRYALFSPLLHYMLENRIKLEQEALIG